jgi:hypothetical protein
MPDRDRKTGKNSLNLEKGFVAPSSTARKMPLPEKPKPIPDLIKDNYFFTGKITAARSR